MNANSDAPALRAGQAVGNKYTVGVQIGAGVHGTVYEVTHSITGRRLALKMARPEPSGGADTRARFEREARAIGRLDHPNIVEIVDFGEEDGVPFIVMERLYGASLDAHLAAMNPSRLAPEELRAILGPVVEAMASAHAQGVLHRDLKPSNVVVARIATGGYDVRVVDFGLAKVPNVVPLTMVGSQLGTPLYMAPEVIRGEGAIAASDVWSMGVMMYRCLTGYLPFEGATVAEVSHKILRNDRLPVAKAAPVPAPERLLDVIERALAPHPAHRWADMGALRDAWLPDVDGTVADLIPAITIDERRSDPRVATIRGSAAAGPRRRTVVIGQRSSDFDDVETVRTSATSLEATFARPLAVEVDAPLPRLVDREGLDTGGSLPGLPTHAQFTHAEPPPPLPREKRRDARRVDAWQWLRRLFGRR